MKQPILSAASLSENAQKLYAFLLKTGGAWEGNCVESLHPAPKYESNPEAQRIYWQYDVNFYGIAAERPVGSESVMFNPTGNYANEVSAAYQELRKAGLSGERNNGYNAYWFYAKK